MKNQNIVELNIEHYGRIVAFAVKPDGNVITLNGENGAGKSTVLGAIVAALTGKFPPLPIHEGAGKARIMVKTQEYEIERPFKKTKDGGVSSHVTIKPIGGKVAFKAPQTMINDMLGDLTVDPVAFDSLDDKVKRAKLLELAGINLDEKQADYNKIYAERTDVNRDKDRLRNHANSLRSDFTGVPEEETNVADVVAERDEIKERLIVVETAQETRCAHENRIAEIEDELTKLKDELKVEIRLFDECTEIMLDEEGTGIEEEFATLTDKIDAASETNQRIRDRSAYAKAEAEASAMEAKSEAMSDQLATIEENKAQAIKGAKLPVDGLGFTDVGVTLNGKPWARAGGAERLRASMGIAMAADPPIKVMLVDEGTAVLDDGMKLIEETLEGTDWQLWIAKASEPGEGTGIVIVDGAIEGG